MGRSYELGGKGPSTPRIRNTTTRWITSKRTRRLRVNWFVVGCRGEGCFDPRRRYHRWGYRVKNWRDAFFGEGGPCRQVKWRPPAARCQPASPSQGQVTDDVPAQLNAGEFVIPKDVTSWYGQKFMQDLIKKARAGMNSDSEAPAQPSVGVRAIPASPLSSRHEHRHRRKERPWVSRAGN